MFYGLPSPTFLACSVHLIIQEHLQDLKQNILSPLVANRDLDVSIRQGYDEVCSLLEIAKKVDVEMRNIFYPNYTILPLVQRAVCI